MAFSSFVKCFLCPPLSSQWCKSLVVVAAFPASLSAQSLTFSLAHPGQYIHRRVWRQMSNTCQSGLPILLSVASSLDLWGWWHVWPDCHLLEESSREHVTASTSIVVMMMSWCLMSSDVIWHIRDKLWPMPKHGSIKATYVRCMRV